MLLVIHSAMRLRSLSACLGFYTTTRLPSQSGEEMEWKMEIKSKELRVEQSGRDQIESLPIHISSAHLGTLFGNYVV